MKKTKRLLHATFLALATLGSLAGCAVTSGQSSVGDYIDDKTISARVKTRFAQDETVSAMRIQVETLNGAVQLSGFARSEAERTRAGELARSVSGVRSVRNDIIVRPPTQ